MNEEAVLESINDEIKEIKKKLVKLDKKNNSGKLMLAFGVTLFVLGLIGSSIMYDTTNSHFDTFWLAFCFTEILITGFSLIHKSLRGAWL